MDVIPKETLIELLREMYLIRSFEIEMQGQYGETMRAGGFPGALHSCEGQEAIAVGVCASLRRDDYVFSTHRGHGHAIAKGAPLKQMAAELLGKATGCSRGRGGSMHLFVPEIGLMGGNGIVGGGLPLALGAGYSARYRGTDQVTVCFFGDGAASQGSFHESLNMAAVMKWPIIYICENNLYAATTHIDTNCPIKDIADRGSAYGIPGRVVDGNDVLAVREVTTEAVTRARTGDGPTLIECKTYRHHTHCMVIPEHRKREEVEQWKALDPIDLFEQKLQNELSFTSDELDQVRSQVRSEMEEALRFAKESPLPDPATVAEGFWAD